MKLLLLLSGLLLAGIAAPGQPRAQDIPECVAPETSEIHADMFARPSAAPAKREDSVNFQIAGKVRSISGGDTIALTGRRNVWFVIRLLDLGGGPAQRLELLQRRRSRDGYKSPLRF